MIPALPMPAIALPRMKIDDDEAATYSVDPNKITLQPNLTSSGVELPSILTPEYDNRDKMKWFCR